MAQVDFEHIDKVYPGGVRALVDCTLRVADGELLVLVGPSGCGKSTLLRLLAGLESVSAGSLRIAGRVVNELSPQARNVAMVFQDYALYPHLSVHGNLEFPLRMRGATREEIQRRVAWAAEMLGLGPLLERLPRELSGGQRQRVAMGRALVRQPSAFLLDEPLSNLDAKLRVQVRAEIEDLQRRTETTMIYVTHDQVEAMTLGDRVAVLARRPPAAGGAAARALRAAGQRLRRRLHREPADESLRGAARRRCRRAGPASPWPARSCRCPRRSSRARARPAGDSPSA